MDYIFLQARMSSSRLPGKVMKTLLGKPMLVNQIERLQGSNAAIIVLTSTDPSDDVIEDVCRMNGYVYFRGDLDNVLERFVRCGIYFRLNDDDYIYRVTGDCPLINYEVVELTSKLKNGCVLSSVVQFAQDGFDVEMFKFGAIIQLNHFLSKEDPHREHVLSAITNRSTIEWLQMKNKHLSVDTKEDFDLIEKIYNHFGKNNFTMGELEDYFETN